MLTIFPRASYSTTCSLLRSCSLRRPKMNEPMPPSRDDPVIKKLDDPIFRSIFTPELNTLTEVFKKQNYELRIAGGAVRDILMGKQPMDIDFATNATPHEMKAMFEAEQIRMINNKGETHGTITPRINDAQNFEITTLRIDRVTDGRRAEVEFTTDWKLDALRRDLTINSMFLDLEGRVYDYFFGYDDLQKRRIVFVGNPVSRIQEDYLRILRYFRFYGKVAEQPDCHDEATIKAIKENVDGLQLVSGERIWAEWSKILSGNYVKELTLKMLECGIAKYVGLPENPDTEVFEVVYDASKRNSLPLHQISLLAVMLKNEDEVMKLHERLKLSAYERDLAYFLVRFWEDKPCKDLLKFYTRVLIHWKGDVNTGRNYICELLKCKGWLNLFEEFKNVKIPRFPVNGNMLKPYVNQRKRMGIILTELKDIWLNKNFEVTGEELLQEVPRIVSEIEGVKILRQ